ncbi:tetratricopeptide repeat protein [Candidatus Manganitrophus noduliformans]|uniref:Tetratricopeptide repeat protein n=1 Tax=Candidatus Manganitrophus noduliformans TaxID=2606439 RepID=A0A7X6I9R0_9BACT|nr:tetratricopeptide repeat protein [Candidatus Manganitrophus noduliformans]NKE69926.1 tetratricopeptide repeat protein [Candidatus Manganitrophus noduliformans]
MARHFTLSLPTFSGFVFRRWLLWLLPVFTLLIYSNTWDASFHLDDDINIVENRAIRIKSLDLSSLIQAGFRSPLPNRFVANMSFALNYYFGGLHVFGYHWINTLIHLGAALLLYFFLYQTFLLQRLRRSISFPGEAAAVAALLWAIHPIQTQSVTYIVQRMTSLSAFFYLLAFVLYLQGRKGMEAKRLSGFQSRSGYWYLGSGLAALLSFGSKETAITLPMMIVLYDFLFFTGEDRKRVKKAVPIYLALWIGTGLIALLYLWGATGAFGALQEGVSKQYGVDYIPWDLRLMTGARVLVYYLSLLFFPHPSRLNLDYDFPLSYSLLNPPTTLLSAVVLIGLLFFAAVSWKKKPLLVFFVFWYFGNLLLESTVLQLDLVFEHRLYLPSVAFFVCITLGLLRWASAPAPEWVSIFISLLLAGLISVQAFWTFERNQVWREEITLWQDTISKSPRKARPYEALGAAFAEQGRFDEAIQVFLTALRLNEKDAKVHTNLGVAYYKKGKIEQAISELKRAIEINKRDALAYYNLANIFTDRERWDDAIEAYEKAIEILPDKTMIRHNLAYALNRKGMRQEAIHEYLEAIRQENDLVESHKNLAALYLQEEQIGEALHHYQEAARIRPEDPAIHRVMGSLYKKQKLFDLALREFEKAAQLAPSPTTYYQLGTVLDQKKEWREAIRAYQKAIELNPKMVEAYINLGVDYQKENQLEFSMKAFLEAMRLQPELAEAHNNLGYLYQQKGLVDLARLEYQLALRFRPQWDLPRINLMQLQSPIQEVTLQPGQ